MKQVFYLKDEPEYLNLFEDEYEPLVWVFHCNEAVAYSMELRILIETNYFES